MNRNNSRSHGQTDIDDEQRNAMEKKQWEKLQMDFRPTAQGFPDNKVYAIIRITPESARELIKHFLLIVEGHKPIEFRSSADNMSIAGFDITEETKVKVGIAAIPKNDKWREEKFKNREFSFTGDVRNLNPIINFERSEDDRNANIAVKWRDLSDRDITKYTLMLDKNEIHYVYQRSILPVMEICIDDVKRGTTHTLQVIGTASKKKQRYQSDLLQFTVPTVEDEFNMVVLHLRQESLPQKLIDFVEAEEEEPVKPLEPVQYLKSTSFQDNALVLLKKLHVQIENRRIRQHPY